jgi:hypothetical protein
LVVRSQLAVAGAFQVTPKSVNPVLDMPGVPYIPRGGQHALEREQFGFKLLHA